MRDKDTSALREMFQYSSSLRPSFKPFPKEALIFEKSGHCPPVVRWGVLWWWWWGGQSQFINPIRTYLCIIMQVHVRTCWKHLTFPLYVWERTVRFLLHKIISFAEKMKFVKNTEISLRGTYTNWVKLFSTNHKFQKSNIIMEGSRHPNFMNPF